MGYCDAYSRAVFKAFEDAIKPVIATATPDWLLHHMEIKRRDSGFERPEEVEIRLVLRPIGEANVKDMDADLSTGFKRLK